MYSRSLVISSSVRSLIFSSVESPVSVQIFCAVERPIP